MQSGERTQQSHIEILERISEGFFALDDEWRFTYVNPEAERLLRRSRDELLGRSIWEVFPEAERSDLFTELHMAVDEQETVEFEFAFPIMDAQFGVRAYPTSEGLAVYFCEMSKYERIEKEFREEIEERKAAEAALRESEERWRAISDAAFEGIIIHSEGVALEINDALARMLGYEVSELMGRRVLDLISPEFTQIVKERIGKGYREAYEITARRKDGSEFIAEVRGRNITYRGRPARATSVRDITERKRAEEALRESEEKYRSLFDTSPDAVLITVPDGRITAANPAAQAMFGMTEEEICRAGRGEIVDTEDPRLPSLLEERARTGRVRGVLTFIRKDGSKLEGEFASAILDLHGSSFVVIRDITDRIRVEEELRRSRDLLQSIIDNTPAAIYIKDLAGRILLVNEALADLLGQQKGEMIGKTSYDFYPHEIAEEHEKNDADVMRAGEPVTFDEVVPENESVRTFLSIKFPLRNGEGKVYGIGGVSTEITERVRAEEALEAERARLQAILETLPVGVFITDAAGRMTLTNAAADRIWGGKAPMAHGISEYAEYKGWWPDTGEKIGADEWALARALTKGETSVGEIISIERFDGTQGTILNSAAPIRDEEGRIIGAIATVQDVTEMENLRQELARALRKTANDRERISAIERVTSVGITTESLDQQLQSVAELVAGALHSHSCTILLVDEATGDLEAHAAYNVPGEMGFRLTAGQGFTGKIMQTRRTVYVSDVETEPMIASPHLKREGAKSLLGTPMIVRGNVVGVMYVDTAEPREFTSDEKRLLEVMAARTGLIVENTRLFEQIQEQVSLLQRALTPPEPSQIPGYKLGTVYLPGAKGAEIGGDFYDVFETEDGRIGIVLGDVSGKGIQAASLAASTRSTARAFAYDLLDAEDALSHTNRVVSRLQPGVTWFATVFLAVLDPATGRICYANAGHPPAALYRAKDGSVEFMTFGNPPVGLLQEYTYGERSCFLDPGDKLVVYTDGISEARHDSELFGTEGVERVLRDHGRKSPEDLMGELVAAASSWAEGYLTDDVAIVVLERELEERRGG